ncbi:MAG: CDP-alcohol phosphatidyltransferase family protein [Patescibacteria group bacterium]|jgi:phosphatidylglycerophosphate synthase
MTFLEFKEKCLRPKLNKMSGDRIYRWERNFSVRLSWLLVKIFPKLKANQVTVISLFLLLIIFLANFFKTNAVENFYIALIQLITLYFVGILDKIDGEVARYRDQYSQRGIYYDRMVHFFYPLVFYFSIGHFYYFISNYAAIFFLTILLAVFSINYVFFTEAICYIGVRMKQADYVFYDLIPEGTKKKSKRLPIFLRLLDYLTYMMYTWTLFYYIAVTVVSLGNFMLSYYFYIFQIILSLFVVGYKIFYFLPREKMYDEAFLK